MLLHKVLTRWVKSNFHSAEIMGFFCGVQRFGSIFDWKKSVVWTQCFNFSNHANNMREWGIWNGQFTDNAIIRFAGVQHKFVEPNWNVSVGEEMALLELLWLEINNFKTSFISKFKVRKRSDLVLFCWTLKLKTATSETLLLSKLLCYIWKKKIVKLKTQSLAACSG